MADAAEMIEFGIPRESLGDYACAPGDKLTLEVLESDEGGIQVRVIGKEKASEETSVLEDEGLNEAFQKGM